VFSKAADNMVNKLVKMKIIGAEDCELYRFGIETALLKGIHLISYLILGLMLGKTFELIIFLIAFIPLREYAGGYHAATKKGCYIISCLCILSILLILRVFPAVYYSNSMYLALFSGVLLLFLVPVESKNKPLDDSEKAYFKSKAGFIIVLLLTLSLFLFMLNQFSLSFLLALVLFYEMIAAVTGKIILEKGKN